MFENVALIPLVVETVKLPASEYQTLPRSWFGGLVIVIKALPGPNNEALFTNWYVPVVGAIEKHIVILDPKLTFVVVKHNGAGVEQLIFDQTPIVPIPDNMELC